MEYTANDNAAIATFVAGGVYYLVNPAVPGYRMAPCPRVVVRRTEKSAWLKGHTKRFAIGCDARGEFIDLPGYERLRATSGGAV